ncbi:ATP-grasp domain-containing protein [Streptomyces candidus]|uniref:Biotin carboxylase n=1 Tax=Streptomyces candidus TaxID=67283 RepID=A0A7X0HJ59_9ACTN|nr:ATP-grasp domain-containing protein [Streptomyces candidus]MBB6438636.1 biotin carboxylase [Streptomyces candidus]GHH45232.1 carboxylase [Streptomyces candidus]
MRTPHLLVLTSGIRAYREYLLRSIGREYRVHLVLTEPPTWERPHVDDWTVVADLADRGDLVRAAKQISERDPVDGVICWDETWILQAAHMAAALGLPGDPEAVERCRDKHRTRQALDARGVPQPGSRLASDPDDALTAARDIGFPVVLKPRALAGSFGVVRANSERELREFVAFTGGSGARAPELPTHERNILVEEYADGQEISVDCVVFRGTVTPLCIARKEVGFAPYFEETGHVVDPADLLWDDQNLLRTVAKTHAALGFTDGATHTEIKLTPEGPKIIEVNARIGGGMIPYLNQLGGGADTGLAAAAVACGRQPAVEAASHREVAAIRFYYPERENIVVGGIAFDPDGLPAEVVRHGRLAEPGEVKSPPPYGLMDGRIAYAITLGSDAAKCRSALEQAGRALRVATE